MAKSAKAVAAASSLTQAEKNDIVNEVLALVKSSSQGIDETLKSYVTQAGLEGALEAYVTQAGLDGLAATLATLRQLRGTDAESSSAYTDPCLRREVADDAAMNALLDGMAAADSGQAMPYTGRVRIFVSGKNVEAEQYVTGWGTLYAQTARGALSLSGAGLLQTGGGTFRQYRRSVSLTGGTPKYGAWEETGAQGGGTGITIQ